MDTGYIKRVMEVYCDNTLVGMHELSVYVGTGRDENALHKGYIQIKSLFYKKCEELQSAFNEKELKFNLLSKDLK